MLILLLVVLFVLLGFAASGPLGAPWVPARKKDLERLVDDMKLRPGQTYIELGCGDGRLVKAAASKGVTAIGYEINPVLFIIASIRNLGNGRAHVRLGNFWKKDLSSADIVMAFLMPKFMERLETKAVRELREGARLVCYIFPLPHKKPAIKRHHWFVYEY